MQLPKGCAGITHSVRNFLFDVWEVLNMFTRVPPEFFYFRRSCFAAWDELMYWKS